MKKKLNGLVVEGCLDKQMIIIDKEYKLFHKIRKSDSGAGSTFSYAMNMLLEGE